MFRIFYAINCSNDFCSTYISLFAVLHLAVFRLMFGAPPSFNIEYDVGSAAAGSQRIKLISWLH